MRRFLLLFFLSFVSRAEDLCTGRERARDRACTADADCAIVHQQLDCCGSGASKGINRSDVARFEAQEKLCAKNGSPCKCERSPTELDDGSRARRSEKVQVACRAGVCTTFIPQAKLTSTTVKALPACPKEACGPAPQYPNEQCPDGLNVAGPGPCVKIDGQCGWARLECP